MMKIQNLINKSFQKNLSFYDYLLIIVIFIFLIIAYIISIVKHNQFLSNAFDLGIYNQLVYKFSHFKYPASTLYFTLNDNKVFFLGDHVTLILPFESLFYWILGKNVLLYLQILYIVGGGIGIYKLINLRKEKIVALLITILFFTNYSIYGALNFDYHTNILGTMIIPWIFYFYYTSNFLLFCTFTIIGMFTKEDISIYYFLIGIVILFKENFKLNKYISFISLVSIIYFLICVKIILPTFSPYADKQISNWKFIPDVGNSLEEIILNLISDPAKFINLMTNYPEKQLKINTFLYSGGIIFLFEPILILPLVPLFLLTLLSSQWGMWGNFGHYNILFSVWIPIMFFYLTEKIKQRQLNILLILFFIYQNIRILNNFHLDATKWTRFPYIFNSEYYHQRFNLKEIKELINLIPDNASVSASNHLIPHLAFRDNIYFYPNNNNAEYIAIIQSDCIDRYYYYSSSHDCFKDIFNLLKNNKYELIYNKNHVLLFKLKK